MDLNNVAMQAAQQVGPEALDPFRSWKRQQYLSGNLHKQPDLTYLHNTVPHTPDQLHRYMQHRALSRLGR